MRFTYAEAMTDVRYYAPLAQAARQVPDAGREDALAFPVLGLPALEPAGQRTREERHHRHPEQDHAGQQG